MTGFFDALGQPHAQLLLRLVLGGLLLIAGAAKLADRRAFYEAVVEYQMLPSRLERPFAYLTPWAEVALGALLLLGLGTAVAAALAVPLFLSFSLAIGLNIARGRHLDCHCFGAVQSERIGWPALGRSLALVLVALFIALGASRFGALEAALFGADGLPATSEVVPIVFGAFVIIDLLFLLPETLAAQAAFRARSSHGSHAHRQAGRTA